MSALVFESFLSTPEVLAVFSETSLVQAMLDFEAALARAQAAEGMIPGAAALTIAGVCKRELFDVPAIVAASGRAGSLAIPLLRQLTDSVAVIDADAAGCVHWGSTSQDVIDTAMGLLSRRALALIDRDLGRLIDALLALAQQHQRTPVLARTLMQPAQVVSLGFKLVAWTAPLLRCRQRLFDAAASALQLQLGGAVGTLAVMGERGAAVAARMAAELSLALPAGAWHTQRDETATLACQVGVLCGALGKIAKDISLMAQAEVGELAEPAGDGGDEGDRRGGSSAMPHKRNPVACMLALAAAARTPHRVAAILASMAQEHERGLGNWQAELAETAGLYIAAHGAVKALAEIAAHLHVDAPRMRANIESLHGLVCAEAVAMRFATRIGKAQAHALLESLSQQVEASGAHLRDLCLQALHDDARLRGHFEPDDIAAMFTPEVAAEAAVRIAAPRLDALRLAAQQQVQPPWAAWLSTHKEAAA